ncbi:hypothetical protein ElyMa_000713600 [Elysia marginata]|uniref:PKD/REJ-like domain-containing protein n=1 Tax=Elysia marginata TaxID=1093978 RepID=A0AAV4GMB7_9GAST|nr:hypothetical protein ElyMa_000713600 [Elysia marginata]
MRNLTSPGVSYGRGYYRRGESGETADAGVSCTCVYLSRRWFPPPPGLHATEPRKQSDIPTPWSVVTQPEESVGNRKLAWPGLNKTRGSEKLPCGSDRALADLTVGRSPRPAGAYTFRISVAYSTDDLQGDKIVHRKWRLYSQS